jgi:asparagine synthase (glutamine-hydrolysing)
MCGIAGIVKKDTQLLQDTVGSMVQCLKHRGPDENGIFSFNNCILGHTRLSIIDLSLGKQPMVVPNKSLAITFNGEIYGYKQLYSLLPDYNFQTTSDTEVILALYQKYGSQMMDHLPGMFSFGIWNEIGQTFFAARDRFGEKPFYYAFINGGLVFASEIKAILASKLITTELNESALIDYFNFGFVGTNKTIFKNIHILPPAHCLTFSNGTLKIEKYWDLPLEKLSIKYSEAKEHFLHLLQKSIERQLVADVQVGSFLSGGLDSSTIVALASKCNKNINTYSFGFSGQNELPYATQVAKKFSTNHNELFCSEINIQETLINLSEIFDEPFSSASNIPMYHICKNASSNQKVILTGDGSDELLGGYTWNYNKLYALQVMMNSSGLFKQYNNLKALLEGGFRKLKLTSSRKFREMQLAQKIEYRKDIILESYIAKSITLSSSDLDLIGFKKDASYMTFDTDWPHQDNIEDAMLLDLKNFMLGEVLVKTDRCSMAFGLELRSPFLDKNLAEFCISLPLEYKFSNFNSKRILRDSMSNILPKSIIDRSKQGFGSPKDFIAIEKLGSLVDVIHPNNPIFRYIDFKGSQKYIESNSLKKYDFIVLCLWANNYL